MNHNDKLEWMKEWCHKQKCILELEGECGFGRECVGIIKGDNYPDYAWYGDDDYEDYNDNGVEFIPEDAYHKHECVAVLGRGENAESQLYDWIKWFDDNNYNVTNELTSIASMHPIEVMMGKHQKVRMTKLGDEYAR